jgi:hypothetical protein
MSKKIGQGRGKNAIKAEGHLDPTHPITESPKVNTGANTKTEAEEITTFTKIRTGSEKKIGTKIEITIATMVENATETKKGAGPDKSMSTESPTEKTKSTMRTSH